MPISEVESVLSKYRKEEEIIESKLNTRNEESTKPTTGSNYMNQDKLFSKNLGQAKERNRFILKSLETIKGNLRSKAIYSPSEMQWKRIQEHYKSAPSLPVTKWRCHLPVIV